MREIVLSGSAIDHRICDCRVGAEGTGKKGQGEAGEAEPPAEVFALEEPLLLPLPLPLPLPLTLPLPRWGGGERVNSAL